MSLFDIVQTLNTSYEYIFTEPDIFKDPTNNLLIVFLTYVDISARVLAFLLYVFYFVAVFLIKDLQRVSLIFVHHVNFINFLFCMHYLFYISSLHPSFGDTLLNKALCTLSEITWAVTRYARLYAMLAVAVYRWIAVYKVNLYKKITITYSILIAQVVLTWAVSIALFLATKYAFNTTYGQLYCFDGYSKNSYYSIKYYIVTSILGTAVPTFLVILIYILISHKLYVLSRRLKKGANVSSTTKTDSSKKNNNNGQEMSLNNESYDINTITNTSLINNTINTNQSNNENLEDANSTSNASNDINNNNNDNNNSETKTAVRLAGILKVKLDPTKIIQSVDLKKLYKKYIIKLDDSKRKNESKFANQFLVLNLSVIVSSVTILIISIRNIVNLAPYFAKYYYLTQFVRILNMVSISVIPLASLLYHQSFRKWFKFKFRNGKVKPNQKSNNINKNNNQPVDNTVAN